MPNRTIPVDLYIESAFGDLEFDAIIQVEYEIDPGQKLIIHPVDSAQEGIEPSLSISSVMLFKEDITDRINLTQLEEDLFEELSAEADDGD